MRIVDKNGKRKRRYLVYMIMIVSFLIVSLTACEFRKTSVEKVKDLDYTVCDESRLPHELVKLINDKKKEPFKFTYRTNDYLYIVVGYGAQDRVDLNVMMTELYLTENAIFVETDLTTKETTTLEDGLVSYPWIAVKCELYDVPVTFK
ncbi:MAG: protease complex subunit PrcB family protein [Lachnospiraceae bacterium]|nr:protease complex subunit PrcB family protein [Lachnospiraceae bacterium]